MTKEVNDGGLTYGQKLIAEAIQAHFGERLEIEDDPSAEYDTTLTDVWDAFDALLRAALAGRKEP